MTGMFPTSALHCNHQHLKKAANQTLPTGSIIWIMDGKTLSAKTIHLVRDLSEGKPNCSSILLICGKGESWKAIL